MDALFIGYISIIHSNQKLIRDDFLGCVFEWFLLLPGVAASTALQASPSSGRASFTSIDGDVFQRFSWCTMTANTNYGCGLVIVEGICEHMSWPFELNDGGIRFTAKVDFYS